MFAGDLELKTSIDGEPAQSAFEVDEQLEVLEEDLMSVVFGQDEAIQSLVTAIKRS